MATVDYNSHSYLTAAINRIKSPASFLRNILINREQTLPTQDIQMSTLSHDREMAPFVAVGSEATMVKGHSFQRSSVIAPNIRIKQVFAAGDQLYARGPGAPVFITGSPESSVQQSRLIDLQIMADMISNTEEWMTAMMLQGAVQWEVNDEAVFSMTFARSASTIVTLLTADEWNGADPTVPRPLRDIATAQEVVSEEEGLSFTDAIMGTNAYYALLELAESGNLPALKTTSGLLAGSISFAERFRDDGAIFVGELGTVRLWYYPRSLKVNGVQTPLIRPDWIEFFSVSPFSERVAYYGAICDNKAYEGRNMVTKRFSKKFEIDDPSATVHLTTSRPFMVPRKPNATLSMKVTNT